MTYQEALVKASNYNVDDYIIHELDFNRTLPVDQQELPTRLYRVQTILASPINKEETDFDVLVTFVTLDSPYEYKYAIVDNLPEIIRTCEV